MLVSAMQMAEEAVTKKFMADWSPKRWIFRK